MMACADIDRRLTSYLDGLDTAADHAMVAEHLAGCARCRFEETRQRTGRTVLRGRAQAMIVPSPLGLRSRCASLATGAARPRFGLGRWFLMPAASAAALVMVAVAMVGLTGGWSAVVASELALDHFKCFGLLEAASGPAEPSVLERRLGDRYGWTMKVPPGSSDAGVDLVGARKCIYHNGGVAHLMYRHRGEPVSVFMLPGRRDGLGDASAFGHLTHVWRRGEATYVLVMRGTDEEVARVAAYFEAQLR